MIQLTIENPSRATLAHLSTKQTDVNGQASYRNKVDRADILWRSKNGAAAGAAAFKDVKNCLESMSASIELCNYCETNEGTDIEHIYPKKLYPESTFVWDNYLLACGTCNTRQKSDGFAIFDPAGSDTLMKYLAPVMHTINQPMTIALLSTKGSKTQ